MMDDGSDGPGPNPTPPPDPGQWGEAVNIRLNRIHDAPSTILFGVPVPPGVNIPDASQIRVSLIGGDVIAGARVKETLAFHDAAGARTGVRAVAIQLPGAVMTGDTLDVEVRWTGGSSPSDGMVAFNDDGVSAPSPSSVATAIRSIEMVGGTPTLVETATGRRTLFTGTEPRVIASYPDGYLAQTRILGHALPTSKAQTPGLQGIGFFAEQIAGFARSAAYAEDYALNPDGIVDPVVEYEGWLYDRCTTFLLAYAVSGDGLLQREGFRQCSYYASKIDANGIFTGKPTADVKYSHVRGLYAYYALTGDEAALAAGTRIAEMWLDEPLFVVPYAAGHVRGPDKLWTERLLSTSMECLYYGARLTGDPKYLEKFDQLLTTAYRHITGDAATLAMINPGVGPFPPQNCFIHSALQADEGSEDEPWCSPWMSELMVDALLAWQDQSGDARVDEIFVRLTRALRDTATAYMTSDVEGDSFLEPASCAGAPGDRMLVPLYGAGVDGSGVTQRYAQYEDMEHCPDASALAAAGVRSLWRQGGFGQPGVGPFATEGESFMAVYQELAVCSRVMLDYYHRPNRAPAAWEASELEDGLGDPAGFIDAQKIGYPSHAMTPQRKFSWWFNMALLEQGMLSDVDVDLAELGHGFVQPAGCN